MSYGSKPADYSVPGEAGGLARIDTILGLDLYGSSFGASPLVFGAFPSLHSGDATLEMLFVAYLFPKARPLCIAYVMWMWWSTMYLTHHYLIDLVGGSIYAISAFFIARRHLPAIRPNARTRLDYLGIRKISWSAFVRSIEYRRNFGSAKPQPAKDFSIVHATVNMDGEPQDVYVLMEPECLDDDKVSLRLRRMDYSAEEEDVGLSSGTSSPSEPASPVTPRSPHFPVNLKA